MRIGRGSGISRGRLVVVTLGVVLTAATGCAGQGQSVSLPEDAPVIQGARAGKVLSGRTVFKKGEGGYNCFRIPGASPNQG